MFEDNVDYEQFTDCLIQVLLIDFGFTAKDMYILTKKATELYETNLEDYMKKYYN